MTVTIPLWFYIFLILYHVCLFVEFLVGMRRAKKEQERLRKENELLGKWVRPTGEKLADGREIRAWAKGTYFVIANVKNDRVFLALPFGWVEKDEISMNVDAREVKK